ncbi:MAG: hypothetical protein R6U63_11410, partial [Longimicrobiales bacterium]
MTDQTSDQGPDPAPGELQVDSLVDTIPCALYGYVRWPDGRSRFVYISAQAEEIFGYPPDRKVSLPELVCQVSLPLFCLSFKTPLTC